jgi:PAS domain S-box-containing protein
LAELLVHPDKHVSGGCRYLHKDGSWRWLEGTGTNLLLDPSVSGIVVNYRDVTDKKRAEEDQLYLKAIVDNSEDGIVGKSLDGIITSWNRGAEKIYGYTHDEIIGKSVFTLFPEDRVLEMTRIMDDLKAGKTIKPMQTSRRRKDGQLITISLRVSPIRNAAGQLIGASAIVRDITERQKAELALRESEERFRNMADTAPVMIWVSAPNTLCTFCNKAWVDYTGRSLEDELGSGWADSLHPEDKQKSLDAYLNAFDRREKFGNEFRLRRWDGEYRWILNTGVPRFSGEHKFEGFIGSCTDITEHKLAEDILQRDADNLKKTIEERSRELDKVQAELKKANRLADIGTLAATVAHELRNPLGVIQMAAFNLKRRHPELAEERHLANIDKKVWEGERIINNLLSYASIKVPKYENITLVKTLDDCLTTIQSRFHDAEISVERHYQIDPSTVIQADQLQLIEIFNNVLTNAFQAFPENKGTIELAVLRRNGSVKVLVKDAGMGIEQDDLEKVFVPFFTRKAKGTGLGLAICNELVHLHNGTIEIDSKIGQGTTVTIDFPMTQEAGRL